MFLSKKLIIIFFGPPGSGKGTQADILAAKIGIPVISPGELLRHERDTGTAIGRVVENKMAHGELVSDEIIEQIIDRRLDKRDANKGFITDGYPRHTKQLNLFEVRLKNDVVEKDRVVAVYIDIDDETVKARIGGRRVCDCGAAYHIVHNKPEREGVCDTCGGQLYQRRDDHPDIVSDRLQGFHRRIKPLLKHFQESHRLMEISGDKSIEETEAEIWQALNKTIKL
jgi:adenylate kinase